MAKFGDKLDTLPLGQIVARRAMGREGQSGTYLTVEIGTPQPYEDDPAAWFCPYRIAATEGKQEKRFAVVGVDAVQALQLALKIIGSELFVINRDLGGALRFLGDRNLGFPEP